jgi:hypothetical protein
MGKIRRKKLSSRASRPQANYFFLPLLGAFFARLAFFAGFAFFLAIGSPLEMDAARLRARNSTIRKKIPKCNTVVHRKVESLTMRLVAHDSFSTLTTGPNRQKGSDPRKIFSERCRRIGAAALGHSSGCLPLRVHSPGPFG